MSAAVDRGNAVWYSVGRTISPAQWESLRVDAGEARTVGEGENPDDVFALLRQDVDHRFNAIMREVQDQLGLTKAAKGERKATRRRA